MAECDKIVPRESSMLVEGRQDDQCTSTASSQHAAKRLFIDGATRNTDGIVNGLAPLATVTEFNHRMVSQAN